MVRQPRHPGYGCAMATYLVTGANRGIGLQLVTLLLERGEHVIAVCRSPSGELEGLASKGELRIEAGVDVSRAEDVASLAARLEGVTIDVLVNNAGILRRGSLDELRADDIVDQFVVNSLGPLRVTAALRGNLKAGSKVGIVTSRMGSIADNDSGGSYGYRMSKAAVNAAGKSLAVDLAKQDVAVALLHPGWVKTEMTNKTGLVEAHESAAGLLARLDELTLENSGTFWHMNGEQLPW